MCCISVDSASFQFLIFGVASLLLVVVILFFCLLYVFYCLFATKVLPKLALRISLR